MKVIIHVWATWCRPCIEELPLIEEFVQKHDSISVIPVSFEAVSAINKFLEARNGTFNEIYKGRDTIEVKALPCNIYILGDSIVDIQYGANSIKPF